jgi:hypothetical protein
MSAQGPVVQSPEEFIARLEKSGDLDPKCLFCVDHFYRDLKAGKGMPFAPRHKASLGCMSGRRAHCTCDTCF